MQTFATRYFAKHPEAFRCEDTPFILAFSLVMLQTDLHNPVRRRDVSAPYHCFVQANKRRMTKLDFIRNNRGIDDGADLDPAMLGAVRSYVCAGAS